MDLQLCEQLISDVDFNSVKEWKGSHPGSQAIAYFPVYAPVEIIDACGMLPVGLNGAGDRLDIQHADARFGSFICSITKTTMELELTHRLEVFDGMLFSSICDTARNLCFVMKRNSPEKVISFLHLPHNPTSRGAVDFVEAEFRHLKDELEILGGVRADDERLRASIRKYNQNRELIEKLAALRISVPQSLPAWQLYLLVRAGNFLPVEDHNAMLRSALEEVAQRSDRGRDSIRVVIEGAFCEQPPLELIKLLEQAGCYIVEDDMALGRRWFREPVPDDADPIRSLASSYVDGSVYSSVRHDFRRPRVQGLIEKVKRARADAVIFLIAKFCEPAYFDYVLFKRELDKQGIPHLNLEFEEKTFTFDRLQTEVETFVESLLFA